MMAEKDDIDLASRPVLITISDPRYFFLTPRENIQYAPQFMQGFKFVAILQVVPVDAAGVSLVLQQRQAGGSPVMPPCQGCG
jgi:hypothetical protein